jgi:membrane-associated protein
METIKEFFHILLHINDYLDGWVNEYGTAIYVILFAIIFVETGLIVMPFLPGDSLLFAAGAICARTAGDPNATMNIYVLIGLLFVAAVLGDNVNYGVGRFLGERATRIRLGRFQLVKPAHIAKTQAFFDKYGTKAIIMARFVPIVRTFTPFIAGVGKMNYKLKFLPFDILGGFLWIASMSLAGYWLGTNAWIQAHFESVVLIIIFISIVPMIIGFLRARFSKKKEA